MAAGCLVLVANRAFAPYIKDERLMFEHGNSEDLARKIKALTVLPIEEKRRLSGMLEASVAAHHSLDQTIQKIYNLISYHP